MTKWYLGIKDSKMVPVNRNVLLVFSWILGLIKWKCFPRQNLNPIGKIAAMCRNCCPEEQLYRVRKTVLQEFGVKDFFINRRGKKSVVMVSKEFSWSNSRLSAAMYLIISFFFWKGAISFLCILLCPNTVMTSVMTISPVVQKSKF